jgi:DNA polymerase-3 subunit beta
MRLRFEKEALERAATVTQSVANPQTSLPILGNVLITARSGAVAFEASDMESCVRCLVQGEILEPGVVTVPAKTFHSAVHELPDGPVDLSLADTSVELGAGGKEFHLTTQAPEDFPEWPRLEAQTTLQLDAAMLARLLGDVLFAIPLREPRRHLLGALFDIKGKELVCVGTDAKKLGLSRCTPEQISGVTKTSAIVPRKVLAEIQRNLTGSEPVRVLVGERQVAFELGDLTYLTNRIEGAYAPYESLIPREFDKEIPLDRNKMLEEIRRASIVSEEMSNMVLLRLKKDCVEVSSRTHDLGAYEGSLETSYDKEPFEIAFNHSYLTDILRTVAGDQVLMRIAEKSRGVIFMTPGDDRSLFLLMPFRKAQ